MNRLLRLAAVAACIGAVPVAGMLAFSASFGSAVAQDEAAPQAAESAPASESGAKPKTGGRRGTGLPLPRFVSLKSGNVNVRRGPGQEYELTFTFKRDGLPVEIVQEFDTWRKIRDSEGSEGWVLHSLLSGQRTAIVAPWESGGPFPARRDASESGPVVAYLQPKVVAEIEECTGSWCLLKGKNYEGWIEQNRLWGVYPEEKFDD